MHLQDFSRPANRLVFGLTWLLITAIFAAKSPAITNTCFEFRVSTSSVPFKNSPENKNILSKGVVVWDWRGEVVERGECGVGRELLSERKTSALVAHMNGIRGDPSTVPLSLVATDNRLHSQRPAGRSCDAERWIPTGRAGRRP